MTYLLEPKVKPADYYKNERPEMLSYIPSNAKTFVELGCGEGNFGLQLKTRNNAEVWGLELEKSEGDVASKKLDKVLIGDISKTINELPDDYFDCVICNDILEHLVDPFTILNQLKDKLKAEGCLVASIPNIRFFNTLIKFVFGKEWEYEDDGVMDKTHLRFFTKKSIARTFQQLGYKIETIQGINDTKSLRYTFANLLMLGTISDTKYRQFAVVAS